ncbi:DUF4270 family protein [Hymenobacter sp. H14-R3]|uniref:DUF4270 family protein n=1 Tax=Hymenobacter sp. H14-R3 TaxID=3046308 RepID=UPI0024BB6A82|nr:DUF4270 family protein [Hymenobacter sp. H14-R3]MDJ0367214.1 DUF4270 family protein [Hymenobacter sp. H14-R3]
MTPLLHKSKQLAAPAAQPRTRRWHHLLLLLAAAGTLATAACTKSTSDIGVGLPDANVDTGAYLIDTITVKSSTVLRDSVVTSTSDNLMVGRTYDPLLGTLTARSYFRLGVISGLRIDPSFQYDSLVLVMKPTTYRYGDTTKTQALVEVHKLIDPISATKYSFASSKLTNLRYDPKNVNRGGSPPRGLARRTATLRIPLDKSFGQDILAKAQAGRLTTQDDFDAYLPGLVLTPADGDNATILGLSAKAADAAMTLYYHDPANPTVVLNNTFPLSTGARHFFQVDAVRNGSVGYLPTTSLQAVPSAPTGEQTYIEGVLGLQTKLEFPYLTNIQQFGNNLTITSATLTALVPSATLTSYVPAPPSLVINTSSVDNRPVETYLPEVKYLSAISATTGINQGSYSWSVESYVQAVLNRTRPNNGLLVTSLAPDLPSRVVLGSQRSAQNKLQLRLYFIRIQ